MRFFLYALLLMIPLSAGAAVMPADVSGDPGVVEQDLTPGGPPFNMDSIPLFPGSFASGTVSSDGSLFLLSGTVLSTVVEGDSILFKFDDPVGAFTLSGGAIGYAPVFVTGRVRLSVLGQNFDFDTTDGTATRFGVRSDDPFSSVEVTLLDYDLTAASVGFLGLTRAYVAPAAPVPLPGGMALWLTGGAVLALARRRKG